MKNEAKGTNGNLRNLTVSEIRGVAITAPKSKQKACWRAMQNAVKRQEDEVKTALAGIEIIAEYCERGNFGIGYQNGKLVEFRIPPDSLGRIELEVEEISLAESVEWLEKMHFAELRLGWCAQVGDAGRELWYRQLYAALKISTQAGLQ